MADGEKYPAGGGFVDRGAGRGTTFLTWVAILLSLLALGLAWAAYNRAGANVADQVQQGTQDAGNAIDAGPDGVDQDDTDAGGGTGGGAGAGTGAGGNTQGTPQTDTTNQ